MMILIYIILIAMLSMAKRSRRRRSMGRYLRGTVDESLSFAGLTTRDVVAVNFDEVVNERTWVSSIKAKWSIRNLTPVADSGPFLVGVAHSDYTATEIEEWIETTGSWNEGDLVQTREVAKRLCRRVGVMASVDPNLTVPAILNEGRSVTTKLGWMLLQGQTLQVWVYNLGTVAVSATTPVLDVEGHANLWPR